MGKNKKRKNLKTKTHNEENKGENLEGRCCHVQDGVKFSNINNVIPHVDLNNCQECPKPLNEPNAKEPLETKDDSSVSSANVLENSCNIKETEVSVKISQESDSHEQDLNSTNTDVTTEEKSLADGNDCGMSSSTTDDEKPGLCVCLRCGYIACSRQSPNKHALKHYNAKNSHPVVVNLSNWVIWCYKCDVEINNDQLNEETNQCLSLLRKALGKKLIKHADKQKFSTKKDVSSNIYSASECSVMKGLTNLGNTCFFNSVMQNLCQTRLLQIALKHLLLGNFEYNVDPSKKNKMLEPLTVSITGKIGPLTLALVKFLQDMASDSIKKHIVNPGNLFSEICKKAPRFKGYRQQDSQELLRYLLDSVRTEEIKGVKRGILCKFDLKPGATEEDVAKKAASEDREKIRLYGRYAGAPVIDTLFGGQLVSSVECLKCHKISSILESFFDLSLSLATDKPNFPCDQYSKKKQQPVNVRGKNRGKKSNDEVKSSFVHEPSKHQLKKKAKQAKKEKKKQGRNSSNTSKSGNKTSENNDEQEEDTAMNGSDVEKSPGNDVEVLEEAVNNLNLDDNDVTGSNVEENSCENKNSVPSSCKDARDTLGSANESRKDISDIQEPRNMRTGEEDTDEPKGIQELRDMRTGEENTDEPKGIQELRDMTTGEKNTDEPKDIQELRDMTTRENESPEDEKVLEMNSVETSEDFENKEEPKTNQDAGRAASSDNVKLSKSPIEFPDSAKSGMNTENMVPSRDCEDEQQRDTGCEETNKEIQEEARDATGNDEGKSEEKGGKNTRMCSDDAKDSKNEGATACHELNLGNIQNSHSGDCAEMQGNAGKDSKNEGATACHELNLGNIQNSHSGDCAEMQGNSGKDSNIDSANKSNPVIASIDLVSSGNGSLNNLKHAFKNSPDVSQSISELNPMASNTLNPEVNDGISSESVSSLNDLKHSGVKINNDNQTTVEDNAINSTNSGDKSSGLYPNNCAPKNEFNFPTNDVKNVSSDAIASCRPLETPVKEVTENQAAGPSDEVKGSESSVKEVTENRAAGPSDEVKGSESSVKDVTENQAAGPSNEVKGSESSVKEVTENQAAGPSNEVKGSESSVKEVTENQAAGPSDEVKGSESSVKEVTENRAAGPSDEVKGSESSVKDVTENQAAGPSNEVKGSESSVKEVTENQAAGPSDEVKGSESSVKEVTENRAAGPSDEEESVINGSISDPDPVSIPDPSGENNCDTTTPVSNELKCDPSLPQNPPNYNSETAKQPSDTNEEPSEDDGCSNESSELQEEGHSCSGPEDCLNGGAETEKSPYVSEILSGHHSLGDIGPFNPNTMSVENCLNKFCCPEKLDGNNKFKCQDCNKNKRSEEEDEETADDKNVEGNGSSPSSKKKKSKHQSVYTEAVKQMLVHQPPPILTLHLKRFHQVGFALKKLAKHVQFPLTLDISPFCHKSSKVATDSEGKVLYSLCGVVEHSGSLHSGHYTAYCRLSKPSSFFQAKFESLTQLLEAIQHMWTQNEAQAKRRAHEQPHKARWFYISDSHVSEVNEQRVLQAQAYLLFYERMVLIEDTETK